jgi:hypothetical protein
MEMRSFNDGKRVIDLNIEIMSGFSTKPLQPFGILCP